MVISVSVRSSAHNTMSMYWLKSRRVSGGGA